MKDSKLSLSKIFTESLFVKNPVFVYALGICSSLAVTYKASNALVMGICMTVVLLISSVVMSALKRVISSSVRIPCAVLIVATGVTLVEYVLEAYFPSLYASLALYIPLVAVSCLVLGHVENFAVKNSILKSAVSALGTGLGYTIALLLMASVREIFGSGTFFGLPVTLGKVPQMLVFAAAPGGLFIFGCLAALVKKLSSQSRYMTCSAENCDGCPNAEKCTRAIVQAVAENGGQD